MAGFLSSSKISEINSFYDCLHTTFAQTITVYKDGKKTIISYDPCYNTVYGRANTGKNESVEYTVTPKTFQARVYYIKTEEELLNNFKTQTKTVLPKGSVKIIVKKEGFDFIQEARRVEFDGRMFTIKSDGSPFGITGNVFYQFFLTPLDEAKPE